MKQNSMLTSSFKASTHVTWVSVQNTNNI